MATVCFVVVILHLLLPGKQNHFKIFKLSNLPLMIILIAAWTLPSSTLTSSTFSQRSIDGQAAAGSNSQPVSDLFANSSKNLSLNDWSRILTTNQNAGYFTNKPVKVSGFIFDEGSPESFTLARFLVTCCTIDAQPVGVPVLLPNWRNDYEEDSWVEIEGAFEERDGQLILIPKNISQIEVPENPYAN
jgi:uncharacterized repeat protein (TIGR03943 family)